ncbi:NADPH:quinone oxidoreductase family protein [Telmatospirillum sp.]|uniref:NADPH:quinone oxidoreductase family protein n=1 Tax=Telmatospirillum sp. TaxID=2079197 RepID=UPI00284770DC|nr:NADPH:quinone oxidoreductase family protein [Telmatospirillum sp.]MDR3438688.1 NADPH:quinone oxidoreductase family protein [Telmatospirillum sp.]
MRAVLCPSLGDEGGLQLADVPPPDMVDGGVRIAIVTAGVNFADGLLIAGRYQEKQEPPFIPGFEVAGRVSEIAPDVKDVEVGDRVMAVLGCGGFAEQVVADARDVYRLPASMDMSTAAGFPIAYGTSHHSLTAKAHLRPGETLLVHGAAGGVGLTAVEIGCALGATVIASAGGGAKRDLALAHGAHFGIDYQSEDLRNRVKALTGGRGVDVVYDPVGGEAFGASLHCTAPEARLLVIGFASGVVPQIPANLLLVKNLSVIGYNWGAFRRLDPAALRQSFNTLLEWFDQGRLKPIVTETLPLANAAEAIAKLKHRQASGKLVLTIEN